LGHPVLAEYSIAINSPTEQVSLVVWANENAALETRDKNALY